MAEAGQAFSETSIYYFSFLKSLGVELISQVVNWALTISFTALQNTEYGMCSLYIY